MTPQHELNVAAQAAWRALCASQDDAEQGIYRYMQEYPNIIPEAFMSNDEDSEGRWRYQKARDLVYGKERQGTRKGGEIGHLRALARERLRSSVLHLRQVARLRPLQFDIFTQFAHEQMDFVKDVLGNILPETSFSFIHFGEHTGLHAHVLHGESVKCPGATCAVIPDAELLKRVEYLAKRPRFDFDAALGYVTVRQAYGGGRVASRHWGLGVSAKRAKIGLREIEAILGPCPGSTPRDVTRTSLQDENLLSDTYPISPLLAKVA